MDPRHRSGPVTRGPWHGGSRTGYGIPPGMCRISAHRRLPSGRHVGGEWDGRMVPEAERQAIMLRAGYLQPYVNEARATFRRRHDVFLRMTMMWARLELLAGTKPQKIANALRDYIRSLPGGVEHACWWQCGFWKMARAHEVGRLKRPKGRPDLCR
jgi:hypothetical protein